MKLANPWFFMIEVKKEFKKFQGHLAQGSHQQDDRFNVKLTMVE